LIDSVALRWDLAIHDALDLAPIDLVLKETSTQFSIDVQMLVESIAIQESKRLEEARSDAVFKMIQQHPLHEGALEAAIIENNVVLAQL